jgi:hypothetical protein
VLRRRFEPFAQPLSCVEIDPRIVLFGVLNHVLVLLVKPLEPLLSCQHHSLYFKIVFFSHFELPSHLKDAPFLFKLILKLLGHPFHLIFVVENVAKLFQLGLGETTLDLLTGNQHRGELVDGLFYLLEGFLRVKGSSGFCQLVLKGVVLVSEDVYFGQIFCVIYSLSS